MATISFKNVGEKTEDVAQRRAAANVQELPLGIVTPVRAGDESEGIFKMHRSLQAQIADNLRNLLMTNWGDRVIAYDFGANLQPLTFELTSPDDFDAEAMFRIKRAVNRYMPFITLIDFESKRNLQSVTHASTGRVDIRVTYNVEAAGITNDSITVTFFIGG